MKPKVIVIDDDHDTVEVFGEFLRIKGVEVVGRGYNGKDAVNLYKEKKPDFVLMDVMMPEYNGFFGLKNILRIDSQAKIIMITADLTDETFEKLMEFGAAAILYKPYEISDVIDTMEKIRSGSQMITNKIESN